MQEYSQSGNDKLNIGPGMFNESGWINLDLPAQTESYRRKQPPYIEYDLMLIGKMPVDSDSVEIVYCSHVLEHVSDEAVTKFFHECFRVLKPQGVLRVVVPDAELILGAYFRNDLEFFDGFKSLGNPTTIQEWILDWFASAMCRGNHSNLSGKLSDSEVDELFAHHAPVRALEILRCRSVFDYSFPGNHINFMTKEKLSWMLMTAGFNRINHSGYGQSTLSIMRDISKFDPHPRCSLYLEVIKD